jgi:hypothetical protein
VHTLHISRDKEKVDLFLLKSAKAGLQKKLVYLNLQLLSVAVNTDLYSVGWVNFLMPWIRFFLWVVH